MDLIGIGWSARDEFLKRLVDDLSVLITEAENVRLEKDTFQKFSKYVAQLRALLRELHAKRIDDRSEWEAMSAVLQKLGAEVRKASDIIKSCNSGSRLQLLRRYKNVLSQLKRSAGEIAGAIQELSLANLDSVLQLKSKVDEIVRGMESVEFKSAAATEAIASAIEESIAQNGRSRDHAMRLLHQIADAVGATPNVSLVRSEIALLKQEKEEMEDRKRSAEALQLSQLIALLSSSEMVPPPPPPPAAESPTMMSPPPNNLINSFTCPLSGEPMEDPVAIVCGHSFERKAILAYFDIGMTACPTCSTELSSLDVTQNISLRSSIQEWKQRSARFRLQSAISNLASDDPNVLNEALEILQAVMENASYVAEVSRQGIAGKLVDLLRTNAVNTKAALKCIYQLAHYSEENKGAIAARGVIRSIVKRFCRGETEPEGLDILLELSEDEVHAEMIGKTRDSIPTLVSLLQNSNPDISQKALTVLGNLSANTHFVIKMAEAGHFEPFLASFRQGNSETRANMAQELTRMHLWESSAVHFEDEEFISALTKTLLYSSSQAHKLKYLGCIKKLLAFPRLVRRFLSDRNTIPALVGLIRSTISNQQSKQEAMEILLLLVGASEPSDYQTNTSLEELHSQHHINVFLQLASTAMTQTKASFLQLLLLLAQKSGDARLLIRSDQSVMAHIFSILEGDSRSEVRLQALQLIYCTAEGNPAGVPLPPSPLKETVITILLNIFTSSPDAEERSAAAGIIGLLPSDDATIDEMMLRRSETLKAIHEVVCAADQGGMAREPPLATTSSGGLLENALAALLRYTEPSKPELQRQVSKLELGPSLVRVLFSTGSSLAKQRTATALYHLSQSGHPAAATTTAAADQAQGSFLSLQLGRLFQLRSWCGSSTPAEHESLCAVHRSTCSSRHALCLVKDGAVRPLVQTVESEPGSGASEAALKALDTLFKDDGDDLSAAARVILDNQGMAAIIEVLEKGSLSTKEVALHLLYKMLEHSTIAREQSLKSRGILINLLKEEELKRKAALVLGQMNAIPIQSSYF